MPTETSNLKVQGMTCKHCVQAVKSSVSGVAGVDTVEVSLEKNLVTVAFDPGKASIRSITAAIEDAGYAVAD